MSVGLRCFGVFEGCWERSPGGTDSVEACDVGGVLSGCFEGGIGKFEAPGGLFSGTWFFRCGLICSSWLLIPLMMGSRSTCLFLKLSRYLDGALIVGRVLCDSLIISSKQWFSRAVPSPLYFIESLLTCSEFPVTFELLECGWISSWDVRADDEACGASEQATCLKKDSSRFPWRRCLGLNTTPGDPKSLVGYVFGVIDHHCNWCEPQRLNNTLVECE